jgi:hypothetical protein
MYNTDTTLYMSEGELIELNGRLRGMIRRLRERGTGTEDLEWDLCYVQRELDLRSCRSDTIRRHTDVGDSDASQEAATSVKV